MSAIRQRSTLTPGQKEKEDLIRAAGEKEDRQLKETEKFVPPTFTIKQLLDAIPAHCFHRSAFRSSLYIVQDFIAIGLLAYAYFHVQDVVAYAGLAPIPSQILKASLHTFISVATGLFGTGLWIIAHECGHQAFSSSKQINNAVGWVLHSALLVPYHSWRISHGRHHAATGHLSRDEVFVPRTRSQLSMVPELKEEGEIHGMNISKQRQEELREAVNDAPLYILWHLLVQQLFGWPMYLIKNASGQKHYPKFTNHFSPKSIIFKPEQHDQIVLSDVGLLITASILTYWGIQRSFSEVFYMYIIPYLWVNHWLVSITFLQHTDPLLPHYSANKWSFARGALCTMDRTFLGPIGAYVLHGICETHVAHHISSKIPHYSAYEATEAIKNFVGPYYMRSEENFLVSLFQNYRSCRWIEDNEDIVFYKNGSGVAQRIAVEDNGGVSDSGVDMSADK